MQKVYPIKINLLQRGQIMYISNSNTATYFDWLKGKGENLITNATLKNIWKARSSYPELLSFSYGTPPVAASEKPKYIVYLLLLFHWIDLLFDLSVICKSIWQNHEPNYLLNTGERFLKIIVFPYLDRVITSVIMTCFSKHA